MPGGPGGAAAGFRAPDPADEDDRPTPRAGSGPWAGVARPSAARAYHYARDRRRRPFEQGTVAGLVVAFAACAIFYSQNLPPPSSGIASSATSDTGNVTLGQPVTETVTCGNGHPFVVESVPWEKARVPEATDQIFLELVELIDGDIDGGPEPSPMVSGTSACAGAPPTASPAWYVVLAAPNGVNVAYFTYTQGWTDLPPASGPLPIANGSALIVLAVPSVAGLSFGLCVLNDVGTATVDACAEL